MNATLKIPSYSIKLSSKRKVIPKDVLYLRADVNYTEIVLKNGEIFTVPKTLKELEKIFVPFDFFRTHKSFMVNLHHVEGYQLHEGLLVKLNGKHSVNLSRRRKDDFLKSINNFPKKFSLN